LRTFAEAINQKVNYLLSKNKRHQQSYKTLSMPSALLQQNKITSYQSTNLKLLEKLFTGS
jgi:hypothetical protein